MSNRRWRASLIRHMMVGTAAVMTIILFTLPGNSQLDKATTNKNGCVDVDFAGAGNRVALGISLAFIALNYLVQLGDTRAIGNVGIAEGLVISNLSTVVTMIVQISTHHVTFGDAVIGAVVLDGQMSALMSTVAWKDVLKSVILTQMIYMSTGLSLVVMGVCIGMSNTLPLAHPECPTQYYFWGLITVEAPSVGFWVYYGYRIVTIGLSMREILLVVSPQVQEVSQQLVVGVSFHGHTSYETVPSIVWKTLAEPLDSWMH
ncbi:hypothetical protein EDC01DRAFT_105599 [Geopyxis carbonaria]|nr:hypothetical protein EDC01DRAFT_105599 [Geopyxis carbonaria]